MDYDLKIVGGFIVDGTGSPGYAGDIGIRDGKVVAMGQAPAGARTTIDARGQVVAPGVVDIHTHYDAQLLWDRNLSISPWHGVTTVVVGNCGFGIAPTRKEHRGLILRTLENVEGMSVKALEAGLGDEWGFETFPEYLDVVEKKGTLINVAVLLGHTPLRLYALGPESTERAARPEEVRHMKSLMREGLEAGALGYATSKSPTHVGYEGRPVPSRLAAFSEIREIASGAGRGGRRRDTGDCRQGTVIRRIRGIEPRFRSPCQLDGVAGRWRGAECRLRSRAVGALKRTSVGWLRGISAGHLQAAQF